MKPTLKDVGFNPLMRSEEIMRYSGTYQVQPESLAVHIADTCMMAYIVANELNNYGENINVGLLLEKCLIHDLDETITGDIPRNTKYANPQIKKDLDDLQDDVLEIIRRYVNNPDIIDKCKNAKKGKEGTILKIVDMLGVARRVLQEIIMRNNKSFLRVVEELHEHLAVLAQDTNLSEFNDKSKEWLRDLLLDASDQIKELHYSNISIIKDFNIIENTLQSTSYQTGKVVNGKRPPKGD